MSTFAATSAALVAAALVPLPALPSVPAGVGCTSEISLTRMVERGGPYMYAVGRSVCQQVGPGGITLVAYRDGVERGHKSIETLDTSSTLTLFMPCSSTAPGKWSLVGEFDDDWVGPTRKFVIDDNVNCG